MSDPKWRSDMDDLLAMQEKHRDNEHRHDVILAIYFSFFAGVIVTLITLFLIGVVK